MSRAYQRSRGYTSMTRWRATTATSGGISLVPMISVSPPWPRLANIAGRLLVLVLASGSPLGSGLMSAGEPDRASGASSLNVPEGGFERFAPRDPAQAAETFRTRDGFRLELVASEPQLCDPVDVVYDADGSAYIVEMRGYPLPEKADQPRPEPISRVRRLIDVDGDGHYETSTVFVDRLDWPTSVLCFAGGVFILDAPDLWYARDTNHDGVADVQHRVLQGFQKTNVQALANNLKWGLDGWVYGAASGNGGTLTIPDLPEHRAVSLSRRDFRFDPHRLFAAIPALQPWLMPSASPERDHLPQDSAGRSPSTAARPADVTAGLVEAVSGGARFGHAFDDYGQRFLCNIRNPIQHVAFPLDLLERNSVVTVPSVVQDVAAAGETLPVYRISPIEPWREYRARRWVAERVNYPRSELVGAGFFTSSSGVTVYRGGAYPEGYAGQVFVADVAANVVHRERLMPQGISFTAERLDDECEFVASTDTWFRPVNFVNAPDGTLHIVDMYREFIEHPWSIPDDILKVLDLTSGNDRGRIWRMQPPGPRTAPPSWPITCTPQELVARLASPHSWQRETAQRRLRELAAVSVVPELRKMASTSPAPLGRIHALWTLDNLRQLQVGDVLTALLDERAEIREQGVLLAAELRSTVAQHVDLAREADAAPNREAVPSRSVARTDKEDTSTAEWTATLRQAVLVALGDSSARVRFQAVRFCAQEHGADVEQGLGQALAHHAADPWLTAAVLCASADREAAVLRNWHQATSLEELAASAATLETLARSAARRQQASAVLRDWPFDSRPTDDQSPVAKVPAEPNSTSSDEAAVQHRRAIALAIWSGVLQEDPRAAIEHPDWATVLQTAQSLVYDIRQPTVMRSQALAIATHGGPELQAELVDALLQPRQPSELQRQALALLAAPRTPEAADAILNRYRSLSPGLRQQAIDLFTATPDWQLRLLAAIQSGQVAAGDVPPNRRLLMTLSKQSELQQQALAVFGPEAPSARAKAVSDYDSSLTLTPDLDEGIAVFRKECAQCHRWQGFGVDVGPPLASIRHRSPQEILVHILDPNREVGPNYIDHVLTQTDGFVRTGIVSQETDASVTLLQPNGVTLTVQRTSIEELANSGRSLMPEGLEQRITPQQMASLIAVLRLPTAGPPSR
jgi:putative membrane-bound dehydrogenase-like protein